MADSLDAFAGTLPYAAETFGIYQPLLGWKSRLFHLRVAGERRAWAEAVVHGMTKDARFRRRAFQPVGPDERVPARLPAGLRTDHGQALTDAATAFVAQHGREPRADEWQGLVGSRLASPLPPLPTAPPPDKGAAPGGKTARTAAPRRAASAAKSSVTQDSVVAGTFAYLSKAAPEVLGSLLLTQLVDWKLLVQFVDPLASFDPATQLAILSPVGIVELFREYFFEFDSFLGPPVGHVWVSPGGTVELYEIHTRRTAAQTTAESLTETLSRSETSAVESDELSTAVGQQNASNLAFGVSANAGVNFGVFHASASASLGLTSSHASTEAEAHKQARQQSSKLSTEIRRNFKTTFRTSVEQTDTSSKRYVLSNATDKLVNYELRRKMLKVGVQLQHIGTQLCWQLYVDEPGLTLGVGELVHMAKKTDLDAAGVRPPDAPVYPDPKDSEVSVDFAFETDQLFQGGEDEADDDETYTNGAHDGDFIVYTRTYKAPPPGTGYILDSVTEGAVRGTDPNEDPPSPVAAAYEVTGSDEFSITLHQVNFNSQPELLFDLKLVWRPDDETKQGIEAEYKKAMAKYTEAKRRIEHTDYVSAVRERVKLASEVAPRDSDDLRDEERTVIFRRIISQLTKLKIKQAPHVTSELIRAIFDIDGMLYFVSPEWWAPRERHAQHVGSKPAKGAAEALTDDDIVDWGGSASKLRDDYFITEDSTPAPLGASLGWLLELDGDAHRNAFLNSPWVKVVVPIRPGRERAALNWLKLAHVEGADGLDDHYAGGEPGLAGKTIEQALLTLANQMAQQSTSENTLATETVFETGFDPLEGGFRATGTPYAVFDQWIEVMPTDQVVAVEYTVKP